METGAVATVTSVFTATLKITQAVYELKAVGEQTRDLLDTTKHIDGSARNVRIVRRQKSALLTTVEKEWIDGEIRNSEKAIRGVAALIEPARVDMQRSNRTKDITFKNRVMFVLRDSPNVAVQLTKLSIATQGLNAAMQVLCNREGQGSLGKSSGGTAKRFDRRSSSPGTKAAPPSYELSEFMNRRRTTSSIPRRKNLPHKESRVTFIDEDRSGDESITLSASPSQATLRTKSSWATTQDIVQSPEEGTSDTEKEVLEFASDSRHAPYLDRFDKSPACTPLRSFGDPGIPIRAEAYSTVPGSHTYIDSWTLETLEAPEEEQNLPTPMLKAQRSAYLSPNHNPSASVSQISLDSSMARIAQSGTSIPDQEPNAWREEILQSHPPLVSRKSEPITTWRMPGVPSPPVPPCPAPFKPQHVHTASMPSLPDGFAQQSLVPAPLRAATRPPPFHFLTPYIPSNENGKLVTSGRSGPPKPTKPAALTSTSTMRQTPSAECPTFLPYPYSVPSTGPFPPLTNTFSDPLPRGPKSAHSPHRSPTPDADTPSPPYPDTETSQLPPHRTPSPAASSHSQPYPYTDTSQPPTPPSPPRHRPQTPTTNSPNPPTPPPPPRTGSSLAKTAHQPSNLQFYKPLPRIPLGRNPSVTSVTPSILSTKSEPATNFNGSRMSRGRMWLEHHAERTATATSRGSAGGPLSGGFLAPLP